VEGVSVGVHVQNVHVQVIGVDAELVKEFAQSNSLAVLSLVDLDVRVRPDSFFDEAAWKM
jgi:hypothetical protein